MSKVLYEWIAYVYCKLIGSFHCIKHFITSVRKLRTTIALMNNQCGFIVVSLTTKTGALDSAHA